MNFFYLERFGSYLRSCCLLQHFENVYMYFLLKTFRSAICLELLFVCGVRLGSLQYLNNPAPCIGTALSSSMCLPSGVTLIIN